MHKRGFMLTKFPVPKKDEEVPCTWEQIYLICDGKIIAEFKDCDETHNFGYFLNQVATKDGFTFDNTVLPQKGRSQYCQAVHDLEAKLGTEGARKEVAKQLRIYADHLESNNEPFLFGCELIAGDKPCSKEFIETISVTLSYPWPG